MKNVILNICMILFISYPAVGEQCFNFSECSGYRPSNVSSIHPCSLCYILKNVTIFQSTNLINSVCIYRGIAQNCPFLLRDISDRNDTDMRTLYCKYEPNSNQPVGFYSILQQCDTQYIALTATSLVSNQTVQGNSSPSTDKTTSLVANLTMQNSNSPSAENSPVILYSMIGLGVALAAVFIILSILFITVCRLRAVKKAHSDQSVKLDLQQIRLNDLCKSTADTYNDKGRISYNLPEDEEVVYYRIDDASFAGTEHHQSPGIFNKIPPASRENSNDYTDYKVILAAPRNNVMTSSDSAVDSAQVAIPDDDAVSQTSQEHDIQNEAKETYFVIENEIDSKDVRLPADASVESIVSSDSPGYSKLGERRKKYDHDYGITGVTNEAALIVDTENKDGSTKTDMRQTVTAEEYSEDVMDVYGLHSGMSHRDEHDGLQDDDLHNSDLQSSQNALNDTDAHDLNETANNNEIDSGNNLHNTSTD